MSVIIIDHKQEVSSLPMRQASISRQSRLHLVILVLAFVVTRGLAYIAGLRVLSGDLPWYWQLLDLDILHHHLFRGLLYLHAQPPLYNAIVGVAEKLSPTHYGGIILALQLCLGLSAPIAIYLALTQLSVASLFSLVVSLILLLNPAAILFEFDPSYTVPVYALNCLLTLALVCYVKGRSTTALLSLIGCAVALTFVRSSYQPVWVVAILGTLFWTLPPNRRQIATAGIVGVLLTLVWPAKNYVLFHHFVSSTWAPFSLSKHWKYPDDRRRIEPWVQQGLVPTFSPRPSESGKTEREFPAWLQQQWPAPARGVPELDSVTKGNTGWTNWNSLALLRMHDAEAKDVSFLLRHDPKSYVLNVARAMVIYFEPSTYYYMGEAGDTLVQYERLASIDRGVSRVCCNIFGLPPEIYELLPPQKFRIRNLCMGAVALYGIVLASLVSLGSRSLWSGALDRRLVISVMMVTVIYAFLVGNLVEVGENMRFRFEIHALVVTISAIFLQQIWDVRTRRTAQHED
jgi:hypothetical protein